MKMSVDIATEPTMNIFFIQSASFVIYRVKIPQTLYFRSVAVLL